MTTTELIELLIQNEKGGISHKSREISLTINGKYMPNPQIALSSTGDGICGAEIDLDIDGDFMEEQKPKDNRVKTELNGIKTELEPCEETISRQAVMDCFKKWQPYMATRIFDFENELKSLPSVQPKTDILDKIRAEIESKMETIIGHYDSTTPIYDMASYKIQRNKAREECIEIIDKYRQEV